MTTMESIFYEAQKKQIAAMNAGIMTPLWDWEKILEDWNRRGPLYNGLAGLKLEEKPVHIDMKTVYVIEEKGILKSKSENTENE